MKVTDPDGQVWRVSRRWVPWRRRIRSLDDAPLDFLDPTSGADSIDDLVIGLLFLVALVLVAAFLPIVLVVFFAAFEFAFLFALLPVVLLLRVFFGMSWTVEVRRGFTPWSERDTGNWSASRRAIIDAAEAIRRGSLPPRTIPAVRWGRLVDGA
ncbi:hypothetical protein GCM10011584_02010 [Nocardioides phosphati]|uniref:DUF983 domain-containing protein n=1 Tax=Nocardioides phosphati TaxID=1867775 RepID=A0ABQ2N4N7_9ACTN|nr:hypothetical protein [Nocardioides phosphati]GGO84448.1 hypothetical protein GCM10011584_02010 [Nocardioides phosphati]